MKIDHIVMNIDEKYQIDETIVTEIRGAGLPYEPKKGKSTRGFKASNIWIGEEYFELINLLNSDGGGWVEDWTARYNTGHRGMICLMLEVEDLDQLYQKMTDANIELSEPKWLAFNFFFGLFSKKLPWRNSYLPFFKEVPFQLGFQQLKNKETRTMMNKRMLPNASDNGIQKITEIEILGRFSDAEFELLKQVFPHTEEGDHHIRVSLNDAQKLCFVKSDQYLVNVQTDSDRNRYATIENVKINC